jgi:hypothetical protein
MKNAFDFADARNSPMCLMSPWQIRCVNSLTPGRALLMNDRAPPLEPRPLTAGPNAFSLT